MPASRPDFWPGSDFSRLGRDDLGRLTVTADYLRAWLARPELVPPEDACAAERALHAEALADPFRPLSEDRIAPLRDPDSRANWGVLADFFRRLIAAGTVEACYLGFFHQERVPVPPLFVHRLAQVIVRAVLDGTDDPFRARAGELFFREQTATVPDGAVLLGDAETVERLGRTRGLGDLGRLLVEGGAPLRQVTLDVLTPDNAAGYWARSDAHDMVFDLTFARAGQDAFARVLEGWVARLLDAEVRIQPVQKIRDERWVWHVGLDAESNVILNDLYRGQDVDEDRLKRLLALFRLDFVNAGIMRGDIAGRPVYLGLAMTAENKVRFKPQNLILNLPLARPV
ncbi:MAG: DUF6352 family protein [Pseudomonadota bacterium]